MRGTLRAGGRRHRGRRRGGAGRHLHHQEELAHPEVPRHARGRDVPAPADRRGTAVQVHPGLEAVDPTLAFSS